MELAGVLVLVVVLVLAFKAAKWVVKLLLWACVLGVGYWLLAPRLGLPMPG